MRIRIEGTKEECASVEEMYREIERTDPSLIVEISRLYPNRGSDKIFRLYIDVRQGVKL